MRLKRIYRGPDGIFGELTSDDFAFQCVTLEHAYHLFGSYEAKVFPGVYECVLGEHRLKDLKPFETYEVSRVTNHSGILFHPGNYNHDSEGCILLGKDILGMKYRRSISYSKETFDKFIQYLKGKKRFKLVVKNEYFDK